MTIYVETYEYICNDRLVRFGFEWFARFCQRHGMEFVVVNGDTFSPEPEVVHDVLSIVHMFSAWLSGLRSYKRRG